MATDWHLFDVEHGYEVSENEDGYRVRETGSEKIIATLNKQEFEDWREHGKPNPKGLK